MRCTLYILYINYNLYSVFIGVYARIFLRQTQNSQSVRLEYRFRQHNTQYALSLYQKRQKAHFARLECQFRLKKAFCADGMPSALDIKVLLQATLALWLHMPRTSACCRLSCNHNSSHSHWLRLSRCHRTHPRTYLRFQSTRSL